MKRIGIVLLPLCLILCLGGCGKEKKTYRKAERLLESSSFAQAEALFSSLDEYEDAADKTRECKYLLAKNYMNADTPDYAEAVRLLEELGAYKDAIALKQTLREKYFFPGNGYRIPCMECVVPDARRTDARGKDEIGSYCRYTYTWNVAGDADEQARAAQFMEWLSYVDGVEGLNTEPYRNGSYFLCVDGERLGLVSSQKSGASVGVSVVLYDEPFVN